MIQLVPMTYHPVCNERSGIKTKTSNRQLLWLCVQDWMLTSASAIQQLPIHSNPPRQESYQLTFFVLLGEYSLRKETAILIIWLSRCGASYDNQLGYRAVQLWSTDVLVFAILASYGLKFCAKSNWISWEFIFHILNSSCLCRPIFISLLASHW